MTDFEIRRFENMKNEFINKHKQYLTRQQKKLERIAEQKQYEEEEAQRKLEQVKFTFGKEINLCDRLIKQL